MPKKTPVEKWIIETIFPKKYIITTFDDPSVIIQFAKNGRTYFFAVRSLYVCQTHRVTCDIISFQICTLISSIFQQLTNLILNNGQPGINFTWALYLPAIETYLTYCTFSCWLGIELALTVLNTTIPKTTPLTCQVQNQVEIQSFRYKSSFLTLRWVLFLFDQLKFAFISSSLFDIDFNGMWSVNLQCNYKAIDLSFQKYKWWVNRID